tara:strand:+ start:163 stop:1473 length:1311 start_codon:yes stop_codon:yes gene_type:complete
MYKDITTESKESKGKTIKSLIVEQYPQLIGEVELLLEESPEWLHIVNEPLQDSTDLSMYAEEFLVSLFEQDVSKAHKVYMELQGIYTGEIKKKRDIVAVSQVEEKRINWIAPDVLAEGQVHICAGDPSVMKSLLTIDLCAKISTGADVFGYELPMEYSNGQNTLIWSAEDDIARSIKPRLRNAKADMDKVFCFNGNDFPELPDDISKFGKAMAQVKPKVMVVDTINAFMGAKIDSNSDKSVRSAIKLLRPLAEHYQCAVILVTHLNKGGAKNPQHRILGSVAYVGFARTVWLLAKNEDTEERILSVIKNNNGTLPNFKYEIDVIDDYPVVNFLGKTEELAQDIGQDESTQTTVQECADEILEKLGQEGQRKQIKALDTYLLGCGYSRSACKRARSLLLKDKSIRKISSGNTHYVELMNPLNLEPLNPAEKGGEKEE